MRLWNLETAGVRGLRDGSLRLDPDRGGAGHLTVVTGPPGAGLTTFLDAIAFAAARLAVGGAAPDPADVLRSGGQVATIRTTWWLDADERALGGITEETTEAEVVFRRGALGRVDADPGVLALMSRYDHTAATSKVISIPAQRLSDRAFPPFGDFELDHRHKRFSPAADKFAGLPQAVAKHGGGAGERARFDEVQRLFGELSPAARLAGVSSIGQLEFSLPSGGRVPLARLGFTERQAFVLAAAPVVLGLQRSVVLLDTPEMGLAPGLAARWMEVLRAHVPEAQWIVASRDPDLLARAAAHVELGRGAP